MANVPPVPLSAREREVLALLALGLTDREAGEALGVAASSVRTYRRRMADKLGSWSLVPMVLIAWRRGEVDLEALAHELAGEDG